MLLSALSRWFASLTKGARGRSPAACRAPRPAAVQTSVEHTAEGTLIRVAGEAGPASAGELLSGLFAPQARWQALVALDLSELRSLSCQAASVLAAYRRGVLRTGGRVRLVGVLQPAVKESLARTELLDLFVAGAAAAGAEPPAGVGP